MNTARQLNRATLPGWAVRALVLYTVAVLLLAGLLSIT
jgi:hypothetical protein